MVVGERLRNVFPVNRNTDKRLFFLSFLRRKERQKRGWEKGGRCARGGRVHLTDRPTDRPADLRTRNGRSFLAGETGGETAVVVRVRVSRGLRKAAGGRAHDVVPFFAAPRRRLPLPPTWRARTAGTYIKDRGRRWPRLRS